MSVLRLGYGAAEGSGHPGSPPGTPLFLREQAHFALYRARASTLRLQSVRAQAPGPLPSELALSYDAIEIRPIPSFFAIRLASSPPGALSAHQGLNFQEET